MVSVVLPCLTKLLPSSAAAILGPAAKHSSCLSLQAFDDIMAPAMLMFNNAAVPESWIPGFKGYVEGVEVLEGVVQEVLKVGAT